MLDWIAGTVIAIVSYVPAQFVPPDSHHFVLIRTMFALLLISLVLLILAFRPLRFIMRYIRDRQSTDRRVDH
jgi:uncharacterized membrane protein